jgi:hypothetical protein
VPDADAICFENKKQALINPIAVKTAAGTEPALVPGVVVP